MEILVLPSTEVWIVFIFDRNFGMTKWDLYLDPLKLRINSKGSYLIVTHEDE